MKRFYDFMLIILFISMPLFSQTKTDTTINKNEKSDNLAQMNSNSHHEIQNRLQLMDGNFFVPLNMKIYQRIMLYDYLVPHKFSQEELRTRMSDDELIAFDVNRLKTKRMLSDIYGEDIIDVENILATLGITREQLIAIAAILKLFLM